MTHIGKPFVLAFLLLHLCTGLLYEEYNSPFRWDHLHTHYKCNAPSSWHIVPFYHLVAPESCDCKKCDSNCLSEIYWLSIKNAFKITHSYMRAGHSNPNKISLCNLGICTIRVKAFEHKPA